MSFYYYPPSPPQTRWDDYYPPYYTGAFPPGVRLGDTHLPQAPGWSAGDVFGRSEVDAWGTTLKVALVLGGIAAAYFLYKTVKEVGPPSRKVGEAAGAALVHMGTRRMGGSRSARVSASPIDAEFEPSSRSPRWLTKYEGE
jgi:hypothetical protein